MVLDTVDRRCVRFWQRGCRTSRSRNRSFI